MVGSNRQQPAAADGLQVQHFQIDGLADAISGLVLEVQRDERVVIRRLLEILSSTQSDGTAKVVQALQMWGTHPLAEIREFLDEDR